MAAGHGVAAAAGVSSVVAAHVHVLAHSIDDSTPRENVLAAWRRLVQRFDPASAQAKPNLMSRILKPPQDKIEHMSFPT